MDGGAFSIIVLTGLILWGLASLDKGSKKKTANKGQTVLSLSMPMLDVDKDTKVELRGGEEFTLLKAIDMVQEFKSWSPKARAQGMSINGGNADEREMLRAVVAVENELATQQGRHEDIIGLNGSETYLNRELAKSVMQLYLQHNLVEGTPETYEAQAQNTPPQPKPLAASPASVFDKRPRD